VDDEAIAPSNTATGHRRTPRQIGIIVGMDVRRCPGRIGMRMGCCIQIGIDSTIFPQHEESPYIRHGCHGCDTLECGMQTWKFRPCLIDETPYGSIVMEVIPIGRQIPPMIRLSCNFTMNTSRFRCLMNDTRNPLWWYRPKCPWQVVPCWSSIAWACGKVRQDSLSVRTVAYLAEPSLGF
jgi:hypothetical protein